MMGGANLVDQVSEEFLSGISGDLLLKRVQQRKHAGGDDSLFHRASGVDFGFFEVFVSISFVSNWQKSFNKISENDTNSSEI